MKFLVEPATYELQWPDRYFYELSRSDLKKPTRFYITRDQFQQVMKYLEVGEAMSRIHREARDAFYARNGDEAVKFVNENLWQAAVKLLEHLGIARRRSMSGAYLLVHDSEAQKKLSMIFPELNTPKQIHEVPVYDGRLKEWRVLNVTTGTVYSGAHDSEEAASQSIKDGEVRGDSTVKRHSLRTVAGLLDLVNG